MNGGNPSMFNMFGAGGMPPMAQNSQTQQNKGQGTQQNGANQVTPPNMPFMNSQGGMGQVQQQQIQGGPLFQNGNNTGMQPMGAGQQNFSTQGVPSTPLFLANAALMAAKNNSNMGPSNGQMPNPPPQQQRMYLANTAAVRMQGMPGAPGNMMMMMNNPNNAAPQNADAFARMAHVGSNPNNRMISMPPAKKVCKKIENPHDHDVMCGRGGLTNYHRGNVWYRRLVKCNRPLYRESAKYTKLLVSKAIVQAVHSQNPPGRFIECDKEKGGHWYEIPYKKALDKTSQALREKDKDDEDGDGDLEGLNLTLVRIPLPEDGSQNTQVAVNTPPPMRPGQKMQKFPQLAGMSHQQVMHQINMMKQAGMTPEQQANTLKAAGMMPEHINELLKQASQQQVNPMMQMMGGPGGVPMQPNNMMMRGPGQSNNMMQGPGQPNSMMQGPIQSNNKLQGTMQGSGPVPAAGGSMSGQQQQQGCGPTMMSGGPFQQQHSMKGPTVVNPSQEMAFYQNLPTPVARLLQNNPRIVSGAPACGVPTVLGPSGEPVANMKKPPQVTMPPMPPSGMPRVLGPSGVPTAQSGAPASTSTKPSTAATAAPTASKPPTASAAPASTTTKTPVPPPGVMQTNTQQGMSPNLQGMIPNVQQGMQSRNVSYGPNVPNGMAMTPFPGMMSPNGVGMMPNGGGMAPGLIIPPMPGFGTRPAAPPLASPPQANVPPKKMEKSPTAALEGLAHIAAVQAKADKLSGPLVSQQTKPSPSSHPSVGQQHGIQQQSQAPTTQLPGTMFQPMGIIQQQSRPPASQQAGIPLMLQSPKTQQGTVMPSVQQSFLTGQQQQMGMMQQIQQGGMMPQLQQQGSQAGMKRQIYPIQTPQVNSEQQFKKQRVDNDTMRMTPGGGQGMASTTNEPTPTNVSREGPNSSLLTNNQIVKSKLDQMTPEQLKRMAMQLMQMSEVKAREHAEKVQQQTGGMEQQGVPSILNPVMEPPTHLARTEHSLGSIGSKSSIDTSSLSDGGPFDAAQVADWLQNFHPVKEGDDKNNAPSTPGGDVPPPQSLEKSVSEALLSLATGPSKLLNELSVLFDRNSSGSSSGSSNRSQPHPPPQQQQQQQQQQRRQQPPPAPAELKKAATMVSVDTQASSQKSTPQNVARKTSPQKSTIPAKGSMIARQTNTTLPRRGTKHIPQKHMLKLQPRPNTKRGQRPTLPLRPRPGSSIPKTLLPLKPRPSGPTAKNSGIPAQLLPTAQPRRKSIQEEMAAICAAKAAAAATSTTSVFPGAPPMLELKRSASIRGGKVPKLNLNRRGETPLEARVREAAEKAQKER